MISLSVRGSGSPVGDSAGLGSPALSQRFRLRHAGSIFPAILLAALFVRRMLAATRKG
jgi:hypothetical protein